MQMMEVPVMKGKRWIALAMALVMTLSLLTVSAGAVSFTDMVGHWAKEDVEALATAGVVNGTSATTFSPDRKMTACEALLFCSRTTGVSKSDKTRIYAAWAARLKKLLPQDMISWAAEEMAVCLETGILSESELAALTSTGNISRAITRENLAMYLVRAMQLAPLAQSLTSYSMSFADTASISAALKPYVYLLNMYGIVRGDQANRFLPNGDLTRAEMATMLRRAIDFMEERGIYAELPAYTSYDWMGGTITAVTTGSSGVVLLTLSNELSGARTISLPAGVEIYENNMLTTSSALKVGQYVRVNLSASGTPESVRVGGALTVYTGAVTSLNADEVTISVSGAPRAMTIDRFTEVQAGKSVGGAEVIDLDGGYTEAVCSVDSQGRLVQLRLSGGTAPAEGLIASVEANVGGGQLLRVTGFNGVTTQYTLPADAAVTINGTVGAMSGRYVDSYVSMQVSNETEYELVSVAVDTVTKYIQGSLRTYSVGTRYDTVTVTDLETGKSTTYDMAASAVVRYEGKTAALSGLSRNLFVTACISGDGITLLDAYPASTETKGTIRSISFGTPTVLTVETDAGAQVSFDLDLTALPEIYRDDKVSSIDKIKVGDDITVTVRYNQVETLDCYSQSANVSGTITRITMESSGVTMDLKLKDGASVSYTVADGVSVTQDDTAISLYALKPDYEVSLVVSGDTVLSIRVDKGSSTSSMLSGTVLVPSVKEESLMIQQADGTPITVDVSRASFLTANGAATYLEALTVNDEVQIYGSYSGANFVATLVIVL